MFILLLFEVKAYVTIQETVQVTPLRRTLVSSPSSECASRLQCFDAVGWAARRASGL